MNKDTYIKISREEYKSRLLSKIDEIESRIADSEARTARITEEICEAKNKRNAKLRKFGMFWLRTNHTKITYNERFHCNSLMYEGRNITRMRDDLLCFQSELEMIIASDKEEFYVRASKVF